MSRKIANHRTEAARLLREREAESYRQEEPEAVVVAKAPVHATLALALAVDRLTDALVPPMTSGLRLGAFLQQEKADAEAQR
jgi:hypothetical protein